MAVASIDDSSRTLSSPTSLEERNPVIDILRGFALFGILLVNFPGSEASRSGAVDDVVSKLLTILVASKFYTTFSFLSASALRSNSSGHNRADDGLFRFTSEGFWCFSSSDSGTPSSSGKGMFS